MNLFKTKYRITKGYNVKDKKHEFEVESRKFNSSWLWRGYADNYSDAYNIMKKAQEQDKVKSKVVYRSWKNG